MTTTVSLANMPSSPSDVAVNFLNQSLLQLRSSGPTSDGKGLSAEYVYASGDPTTETSVLIQVTLDEKQNLLRCNLSLRTIQTVTVDSVVTEVGPVVVSLTWTTPGRMEDSAKVLSMIGTAYSLVFNGVTTKVPNTGTIDALNRGIVGGIFS